MNKWSVHVTDFGKIKEAYVRVSPLTLFVGDNNSGKSYMMTLIYGLLNISLYHRGYSFDEKTETYQKCCKVLDKMIDLGEEKSCRCFLSKKEVQLFEELLNETLFLNKSRFLQELFNKEMDIGQLAVDFSDIETVGFEIDKWHDVQTGSGKIAIYGFDSEGHIKTGYGMEVKQKGTNELYRFFLSYIMENMLNSGFKGHGRAKTIYFPTARTGFLLTYKSLVGSALEDKFNMPRTDKNLLTKPTGDFLTLLSSLSVQKPEDRFSNIIKFIEKHVITGHINVSDLPTHDIMYTPEGNNKELPMFVASGVVTEIAPLLLFLRYAEIGTFLIEEPEISLHPQLQWEMARVLIRLMNIGTPVFVTTHSDIILQHMNNMIKLQYSAKKDVCCEKMGYTKEDLLNREDIAVYQFDVKENKQTQVTRLVCGDYGFEAMTFYHVLSKLNEQIGEIENTEE